MAQHDYTIANQTFPNTRTDLNNVFAAIVSQNSGATAPSTTYAYQLWYDTTTDILKMRNANDDAWIELFTIDQVADTASPAGAVTPNPSLIINGGMQVAQRGTSSTTNGYGSVDRFENSYSGGTVTGSQESLTSSDAPYALGFRNYFRQTNTATTSGAADYRQLIQKIESQNIAKSGWNYTSTSSYITVSCWVRSSVAGKYGFYLLTFDSPSYQFAFTETLVADTWTKVTKTIPGNSNLVFNNDNGVGVGFQPVPWFGTDYTDSTATMDSWVAQDTAKYLPDDIVNWAGTSGATFDLTGVKLEVGETATPFVHRSYGEELALCQRYFTKLGGDALNDIYGAAYITGSGFILDTLTFPVKMRAIPTGTVVGTWLVSNVSQPIISNISTNTFVFYAQGTVIGQGYYTNPALTAYTTFDAEL